MFSSSNAGRLIRQYRFLDTGVWDEAETPAAKDVGLESSEASLTASEVAEDDAQRILDEARRQAEEIWEQARAAGYEAGLEAGRAEGLALVEQEAKEQAIRMHEILQALVAQRKQILASVEKDLVDLALAIAHKVIGDAASAQRDLVMDMARRAIEVLGRPDAVRVHLNPADAERLAEMWAGGGSTPEWTLVPDERVAPGGCIVTAGASEVDARPETQLGLIQQAFKHMQGEPA